jgi:hypothetical protein
MGIKHLLSFFLNGGRRWAKLFSSRMIIKNLIDSRELVRQKLLFDDLRSLSYLSVHLSIYLSIYLLSFCLSVCYICMSFKLCIHLFTNFQSGYHTFLLICLIFCVCVYRFVSLSFCHSVWLHLLRFSGKLKRPPTIDIKRTDAQKELQGHKNGTRYDHWKGKR